MGAAHNTENYNLYISIEHISSNVVTPIKYLRSLKTSATTTKLFLVLLGDKAKHPISYPTIYKAKCFLKKQYFNVLSISVQTKLKLIFHHVSNRDSTLKKNLKVDAGR